jgi:hypothetical protein
MWFVWRVLCTQLAWIGAMALWRFEVMGFDNMPLAGDMLAVLLIPSIAGCLIVSWLRERR